VAAEVNPAQVNAWPTRNRGPKAASVVAQARYRTLLTLGDGRGFAAAVGDGEEAVAVPAAARGAGGAGSGVGKQREVGHGIHEQQR